MSETDIRRIVEFADTIYDAETGEDAADNYASLDGWDADGTRIEYGYTLAPPDSYIDAAEVGEVEIQLPDELASLIVSEKDAEQFSRASDYFCSWPSKLLYRLSDVVFYLIHENGGNA